jgi:hypothetical protein
MKDVSENLKEIVQSAQCDTETYRLIRRHANGILTHLGMEHKTADKWLDEQIRNKKIENLSRWENELHSQLKSNGIYKNLDMRMKERAQKWFNAAKLYFLKTDTLDLGGGSGEVANLMQKFGCKTTIADVINWNKFDIPFLPVKNNKIRVKDKMFNQVVLFTVFHHTDDVSALVKETFRVANKRVIFIESVTENLIGYRFGAWIDWFYNRIIHYSSDITKKIDVPCNFLPSAGWEQLVWKLTGLKPTISTNLGIFQFLNPENHHLFVYDIK